MGFSAFPPRPNETDWVVASPSPRYSRRIAHSSAGGIGSSPEKQARWVRPQFELATQAEARHVFQLLFTDLDLVAFGQFGNAQLVPFATLGLVTTELVPKPGLAEWDAAFARPRR